MRFYELLQRVRFEDMVPTLKDFCISDRQAAGQLVYYKQAFDCLRLMKPKINDGTMRVGTSEEICSIDADIKWEKLKYLYDTAWIYNDRFESHTEDPSKRIDYFLNLIENWSKVDYRNCDSLVIVVIRDKKHPFSEEEMYKLNAFVDSCKPLDRAICRSSCHT